MLRIGLAIYLMVVTTTGPWLCCCAAADLARWMPTSSKTPVPTCCCCQSTEPDELDPPVPAKQSPNHCPCRQHRVEQLALPAKVSNPADLLNLHDLATVSVLLPSVFSVSPDLLASAPEGHPISPFLDPQSLLHVFHLLRC